MIVEEVETELPAGDTDKQVIIKLETVLWQNSDNENEGRQWQATKNESGQATTKGKWVQYINKINNVSGCSTLTSLILIVKSLIMKVDAVHWQV
jgi:hypothetical protein